MRVKMVMGEAHKILHLTYLSIVKYKRVEVASTASSVEVASSKSFRVFRKSNNSYLILRHFSGNSSMSVKSSAVSVLRIYYQSPSFNESIVRENAVF